jgi:hypothetical protein
MPLGHTVFGIALTSGMCVGPSSPGQKQRCIKVYLKPILAFIMPFEKGIIRNVKVRLPLIR